MTQDEIIRMAREAGFQVSDVFGVQAGAYPIGEKLERFAALVAAHEREKQAEQEPVAWVTAKESFCGFPKLVFSETQKDGYKPLYAAPVRTEDLTASEIRDIWNSSDTYDVFCVEFARAVIAADREKNK